MTEPDPTLAPSPGNEIWRLEGRLWALGAVRVAGVDEAGRGAWAGPLAVGAVILPVSRGARPYRDSKTLSPAVRERLALAVKAEAVAWAVELAPAAEVDAHGVLGATLRAAHRAVARLSPGPDALVTDYLRLETGRPYLAPARADANSYSVAAASILAKVTRDRVMVELEERFPGYGFARHKGYGVPEHQIALEVLGPCPEHRRSFAPVARRLERGGPHAPSQL